MRAIFVLVTILSFGAPQVPSRSMEFSSATTSSISLATPAASQIARPPSVKTGKTVSFGSAILREQVALFPSIGALDTVSAQTCEAPHLDLEGPPLAPRPPPLN